MTRRWMYCLSPRRCPCGTTLVSVGDTCLHCLRCLRAQKTYLIKAMVESLHEFQRCSARCGAEHARHLFSAEASYTVNRKAAWDEPCRRMCQNAARSAQPGYDCFESSRVTALSLERAAIGTGRRTAPTRDALHPTRACADVPPSDGSSLPLSARSLHRYWHAMASAPGRRS